MKKTTGLSVFPIVFAVNQTGIHLNYRVNVTMTDYYFLQITNCTTFSSLCFTYLFNLGNLGGGDGLGTLTLNGPAAWMNPYGYLPGESYALLPVPP